MGALVRLMASAFGVVGRWAAGESSCCGYPGCHAAGLLVDLDGGPGGLCPIHGGET